MTEPAYDCLGRPVYPGDYVECTVHQYMSMSMGDRRRVKAIQDGNFVLNNDLSPRGTSCFRASNFRRVSQHAREHKQEKSMLHIAVLMVPSVDLVDHINNTSTRQQPPMFAGRTKEEIQERIRARLSEYPDEKWLICSGNTIGERADPPVRFRSI